MKKTIITIATFITILTLTNCGSNNPNNPVSGCTDPPIVLFTLNDDRQLGAQVATEIDGNKAEYPTLDSASNPVPYRILYKMRDKILNSGKLKNKDEFAWRLRIIKDDATQNAFCTPGGYIYIYTGIIKVLDNESQLAGVLGHEMGHADLRHSVRTMQNTYGTQLLIQIIAGSGTAAQLATLADGLRGLKNSRCHETQADESSVNYLSGTDYPCNSAAKFFEKIVAAGGSSTPVILSTHPDPGNRVEIINKKATEVGCSIDKTPANDEYTLLKSSLGI
ncbi:MAG: peptidase M48 [Bacteroidetes bacterium]|nr:MAG: peptidase M48 [Bacteroidota bacterium]